MHLPPVSGIWLIENVFEKHQNVSFLIYCKYKLGYYGTSDHVLSDSEYAFSMVDIDHVNTDYSWCKLSPLDRIVLVDNKWRS